MTHKLCLRRKLCHSAIEKLDSNKRENDLSARLLRFNNCTKVKDGNTEDLRVFNANMADNHLIQHKTQNLLNAVCKRQEIIS